MRILNTNLPPKYPISIALTRLFGCNKSIALVILSVLGISPIKKVSQLDSLQSLQLGLLLESLNRPSAPTPNSSFKWRYFLPQRSNPFSCKETIWPRTLPFRIGTALKQNLTLRFRALVKTNHRHASRHLASLPVRGQRTKSNANTQTRLGSKRIHSFLTS